MAQAIRSNKLPSIQTDQAIRSKKLASISTAWAIHSKILASVRMARAICSKKNCQLFEQFKPSRSKKFVNHSSYLLGNNKIVTRSFHWKVKCCKWSLCWRCHLGSIVQGWVNCGWHNCSLMWKPFIKHSRLLTVTTSHHDQFNFCQKLPFSHLQHLFKAYFYNKTNCSVQSYFYYN